MAAVEGCEDPWLRRVEIDAFDTLAPGEELALYSQKHGISDCYGPSDIFLGRVWEEHDCHGSGFGAAAPMRLAMRPRVLAAPLKLFNCGRTRLGAVKLGCAYLDVEPHAGQMLSRSWLESRRGQSLVEDSIFTVVGRMSVAGRPSMEEGPHVSW